MNKNKNDEKQIAGRASIEMRQLRDYLSNK